MIKDNDKQNMFGIFQEGEPQKQPEEVQPGDGYECLGMCRNSTKQEVFIEVKCNEGEKPGQAFWFEEGRRVTNEMIIDKSEDPQVKEQCEDKCSELPDVFDWECFLNETEVPGGQVGPGVECKGQCKNLKGTNATSALTVQCKLDEKGNAVWQNKTEVISDKQIEVQARLCPCHELPDVFAWKCFAKENVGISHKEPARDGTKCKGYCFEKDAKNTSAIIDIVCVLKDNMPNWETPGGVVVTIDEIKLSADRANETECKDASCEDIKDKDPGSLFKWNCTLKVLITVI